MSKDSQKELTWLSAKLRSRKALLVIAAILLLTNVGTLAYFYSVQQESLDSFKERYPFIDISRHLMPQEHFISTLQPIRERFQEIVTREGASSISIYFEYLNTGANISINQDLRVFPASLVKVPLAMAVMKKIERGEWQLHNELVLMGDDRDYEWGDVHKRPIGTRIAIEELLEEMLISSDNTAFRMLYRNLSFDELQDVLVALGLEDLFNEEGKITAKEYTRLFRALYTSSYLNRENSQRLLDILGRTEYDEYLGQGIPDKVPFVHKIGENEDANVVLDAGIVYVNNRPYLIAVAIDYGTEGIGREQALAILGEISRESYAYITGYENP